ncbi:hypothetical protein ACFS27_07100 [Promicromonospora vindobonensis]|uniref:Lipoprotein n=1 Tax=Promicromonospora vindobonensis TaxID=195748 RepID=A0ABW5VSU5_9MICO
MTLRSDGAEVGHVPASGAGRGRSRTAVAIAAVLSAGLCLSVLLAACSGGAVSAQDTQAVRIVVPDANIREPSDPCSGARAFRYAHPEAAYEVLADGTVLAAGALPEGRAEKAFSIDLGADRQPTVCVMSLDVPASIDLSGAELMIGEHGPVPIEPNPAFDDAPEAVLR